MGVWIRILTGLLSAGVTLVSGLSISQRDKALCISNCNFEAINKLIMNDGKTIFLKAHVGSQSQNMFITASVTVAPVYCLCIHSHMSCAPFLIKESYTFHLSKANVMVIVLAFMKPLCHEMQFVLKSETMSVSLAYGVVENISHKTLL